MRGAALACALLLPCLTEGFMVPSRPAVPLRNRANLRLSADVPDTDDGSFGKSLRRLQASPTRAAMLATYVAALYYVGSGTAPQGSPDETLAVITECLDTAAEPSIFFSIFNALGVVPAIYAAVLLPGAKDQKPVPPALIATSFFAGYGGLGPYLIFRQPRPDPVLRSDLGFLCRTVTESKLVRYLKSRRERERERGSL